MNLLRIRGGLVLLLCAMFSHSALGQEKLILPTIAPPGAITEHFFRPWTTKVVEQSKGTIAIELRPGIALATFLNMYERVEGDIAQIGWIIHGLSAGQFPRTEVGALPLLNESSEEGSVALWRLYSSGLLDSEYRDITPLVFGALGVLSAHFSKPLRSADNFNGLRMSVYSKSQGDTVAKLGGVPASIASQDLYEALKRGTVDGMLMAWGAFAGFKYGEVTSFHIDGPLGSTTTMLFMTRKKFDSLPVEARKAFQETGGEAGSKAWGYFNDEGMYAHGGYKPNPAERTIVRLTPEQRANWVRAIQPVQDEWAASRPNGREVLEKYKTSIAEYRSQKK